MIEIRLKEEVRKSGGFMHKLRFDQFREEHSYSSQLVKRDLASRSGLPASACPLRSICSARATGRTPGAKRPDRWTPRPPAASGDTIHPARPRGATRLGTTTSRWGDQIGSGPRGPLRQISGCRGKIVSSPSHRLLSGSEWQLVPPQCRERGVCRDSSCIIQNILRQLDKFAAHHQPEAIQASKNLASCAMLQAVEWSEAGEKKLRMF